LLVEKGAPVSAVRTTGGLLNDTVKRAMPELSQFLVDHGASLESKERENFTLLMQAVTAFEPAAARDHMIEWLLAKGVNSNAKNDRGDPEYQLAARGGGGSTLDILVRGGAKRAEEEWPKPGGAPSAEAAIKRVLPRLEVGGEPGFKTRGCVSCH